MTPIKDEVPPQIKHQITYFLTPGGCGAVTKKKKNIKIKRKLYIYKIKKITFKKKIHYINIVYVYECVTVCTI